MGLVSRIPILRNNPVFLLEVRRAWTWGRALGMGGAAVALTVAAALYARAGMPWAATGVGLKLHEVIAFWAAPVLIAAFLVQYAPECPSALAALLLIAGAGATLARMFAPAIMALAIVRDRQAGVIAEWSVTHLTAGQLLAGKLAAAAVPLAPPFVLIGVAGVAVAGSRADVPTDAVLWLLVWTSGEFALAGTIGLACSCFWRHLPYAVAAAYVVTCGLGWAILHTAADLWSAPGVWSFPSCGYWPGAPCAVAFFWALSIVAFLVARGKLARELQAA